MVYLRKIEELAWIGKSADDSDSISDIGTTNHELSVWKVKDDLSDLDDMALALAMTRDSTLGIMVVLLDPSAIESQTGFKVSIEDQEGLSLYLAKNNSHKNFMLYTLSDMGCMASYIHSLIDTGQVASFRYYDENQLRNLAEVKFRSGEFTEDTVKSKGKWKKLYKDYVNSQKGQKSQN